MSRPLNEAQERALVGLSLGYLWRPGSLPSLECRGLVEHSRSWANGQNGRVTWRLTDTGWALVEGIRGTLANRWSGKA